MRFVDALKWTLIHRGVSLVALLIGLALAGAGVVLGLGDVLDQLADDPASPGDALQAGNPIITVGLVVVGVVVWLVGKSYALYLTMPSATGKAATDQFDMKQVRSEVLDALDDRLATIEDDLEATRRSVAELKRRDHAAAFDETDSFGVGSRDDSLAPTTDEPASTAPDEGRSSSVDSATTSWEFGDDRQGREVASSPAGTVDDPETTDEKTTDRESSDEKTTDRESSDEEATDVESSDDESTDGNGTNDPLA